jgi:mono/diheme cytochrome c family protein
MTRLASSILCGAIIFAVAAGFTGLSLSAQPKGNVKLKLDTGKEIYEAGCISCHGPDGKGQMETTLGFQKPENFPDFTRCDQTTPADDISWKGAIRDGGPPRGLSQIMPSFGDMLTSEQMDKVIHYLRGFCTEKGWPRGELKLPLAIGTEKAFPEDEEVIYSSANVRGTPGVSNTIVHEQRFGKYNQIEVAMPVDFVRAQPGTWYGGFGDVTLGAKRVMFSSLAKGSILSLFGAAILPVGNTAHALGSGTATFETYAAYGQILPWKSFVQVQGGALLPKDINKAPQSVYFRAALGKSFNQNRGLGRLWSPMFEFLSSRDLVDGARTNWDVMPEAQVTLSRRQHIRAALGVRVPITNTAGRPAQLALYILWDWQDGKLLKGW